MTDKVIAFTTCSSESEALSIARGLLDARLAACVSVSQPVRSLYHWQGAIQDDAEHVLTIKTRRGLVPRLKAELRAAHSYTTPELVVLPIVDGLPDYLDWMDKELAPDPSGDEPGLPDGTAL
jgi:periplasmic divalent cation tolerance protein